MFKGLANTGSESQLEILKMFLVRASTLWWHEVFAGLQCVTTLRVLHLVFVREVKVDVERLGGMLANLSRLEKLVLDSAESLDFQGNWLKFMLRLRPEGGPPPLPALASLTLPRLQVDDGELGYFRAFLADLPALTKLDLESLTVHAPAGIEAIGAEVCRMTALADLDIRKMTCGAAMEPNPKPFHELISWVGRCTRLTSLQMLQLGIDSDSMVVFLGSIASCSRLQSLDLSHNMMHEVGGELRARRLGQALSVFRKLKLLILEGVYISHAESEIIIAMLPGVYCYF
eukprot:1729589-Rhodomonas_salina.3